MDGGRLSQPPRSPFVLLGTPGLRYERSEHPLAELLSTSPNLQLIALPPDAFFQTATGREPLASPITTDRLHVRRYGNGPKVMISLHGFGRNGRRMERLALALGREYTTYTPDLPYHGRSEWVQQHYTPETIAAVFNALLAPHRDQPVYLLGHSLGGRVMTSVLPFLDHPDIRDLGLVAPDGAGGRYTNWIDTLPAAMVRPLAKITERPRYLLRLSQWLRKRGVINRYSAEYLKHNLKDGTFRRRIAGSLRSVLHFPPRPRVLEKVLQERGMRATVFAGDKDPLLHPERLAAVYGPLPSVDLAPYNGSHWLPEQLLYNYYVEK